MRIFFLSKALLMLDTFFYWVGLFNSREDIWLWAYDHGLGELFYMTEDHVLWIRDRPKWREKQLLSKAHWRIEDATKGDGKLSPEAWAKARKI